MFEYNYHPRLNISFLSVHDFSFTSHITVQSKQVLYSYRCHSCRYWWWSRRICIHFVYRSACHLLLKVRIQHTDELVCVCVNKHYKQIFKTMIISEK